MVFQEYQGSYQHIYTSFYLMQDYFPYIDISGFISYTHNANRVIKGYTSLIIAHRKVFLG